MKKRPCPICGNNIVGRADKKYCSTSCKNKFYAPSQRAKPDSIKTINRFLFQNYKIMASIFEDEKKKKIMVPRILLDKMGFNYNYCTGCYINNEGKLYHYIYEFGWMEFSTQQLMLIRK